MGEFLIIGKSIPKVDALDKVTGQAEYTSDVKLHRMLHAKILRSPYAHAKIINIDTSKAKKLAGVKVVATGKDAPDERMYLLKDRYILARDTVRFVGEPVAAVAAEYIDIVEEALDLIEVDYEELPAIFDIEEAMQTEPPVIVNTDIPTRYFSPFYQGSDPSKAPVNAVAAERPNVLGYHKIRQGNTEKGFQESDLVLEERYVRPRIQHCPMEPNTTVVRPESDGGITVWATSQTIYPERDVICRLFQMPVSKVRMIGPTQGGGFGSRVEGLGASIYVTILLSLMAKRPVKLAYTRDEVFIDGVTEMPMVIYLKDGVKKDGTLVAREMKVIINAGAYSGISPVGCYNSGNGSTGTYLIPNFKYDAYLVATNEPVSGPYRGYAANPVEWAIEAQTDLIAEKLGISPVEFRRNNVVKEGDINNAGWPVSNIQIEDSINKVLDWIEWDKGPQAAEGSWEKGLGFAMSNKMTTGSNFASVVIVKVHQDAVIEVRHSVADLGQGCNTALAQIAAEEFATSVSNIKIVGNDSAITPYDHGTVSNRVTFHAGNALRVACADAKRQILEQASAILMMPPENLVIEDGLIHKRGTTAIAIKITDLFAKPEAFVPRLGEFLGRGTYVCPVIPLNMETGQSPRPYAYVSWGACAVEVAVNVETGEIKVLRIAQCFDMGEQINPKICEGQTEGGMGQGIGSALYEVYFMENGVVLNPNFVDYRIPSIMEVPTANMKAMAAKTEPLKEGPYGAKGFCEGGLLPMTPAITNAVADAVGVRIKEIPITREKVLKALNSLE
ncbi:xanthine dehydrogenase family protein molybdopterin-binding subunit [Chloroflexota bacterium]